MRNNSELPPPRARPSPSPRMLGPWVGYAAASWALVFAALHFVWAGGWYIGLNEERARAGFARTWFLIYDLVIAVLCVLAVFVALGLVHHPWGQRLPRRLIIVLAWLGTGVLVLRGGGGLAQALYLLAAGKYVPDPVHLYDLWFCLGAVLFSLSLRRFRRGTSAVPDAV